MKKDETPTPDEETPATQIDLEPIQMQTIDLPIIGLTPLIVHRWSEKAKKQMLDAQTSRGTRKKKDPKNPHQDYLESLYALDDGTPGFPSAAFKAAMVGACRRFDGITMVVAKTAFVVLGDGPELLVPIIGDHEMREDTVRVGMGTADLRYRAMFPNWGTTLRVTFDPQILSLRSIVALANAAGFGGVGEWRPSAPKSSTGTFGMFAVYEGANLKKEVEGR